MIENILQCDVKIIENPYKDSIFDEIWGNLKLTLISPIGNIPILDLNWNLELFIDIFSLKFYAFFHKLINDQSLIKPKESIAEAWVKRNRELYFDNPDEDEDYFTEEQRILSDKLDGLLDHEFTKGFDGYGGDYPIIFMGCNHGTPEISVFDENNEKYWAYSFDMNDFASKTHAKLIAFMEQGLAENPHFYCQNKNRPILEQLKKIDPKWLICCCSETESPKIYQIGKKMEEEYWKEWNKQFPNE